MKNKLSFVLFLTMVQATFVFCQNPLSTRYPFLHKVELRTKVSFDNVNGLYSYNYTLKNDINNRGDVWIVKIDISRDMSSMLYDTIGLRYRSPYVERTFRKYYFELGGKVIPVGFPKLPSFYWTGRLERSLYAAFDVDTLFPKPGATVSGFIMTSKALPGIRRLMVLPNIIDELFFPNIEDTTATMSIAQVDSIREVVNFYGWTIGPYAPPAIFDANVLFDTLASFTVRSRALGWLKDKKEDEKEKDDGELKELDKRLLEARKALVKGDSSKARKELEEFVEKVEEIYKESTKAEEKRKEHEVVMTSEAYALLKYNAEFLINKLPKKKNNR